ncbi:ribosome-recycling factor, mitochondrial-like isoform X2 [Varroa jacobsoni]|uniref:ribosome-recycling factor, mitochondrial-like isoform X2 n=1 Tax=Varroa jacobsoni TaxID=62625 RepID=UPI000BF350A1|nr:ribosome-recycling factor, mitochondrial-like isoform X2 [Varroa jacobsoni]
MWSTRHSSARPKVELRDDELFEVMSVQLFRDSISRALQNLSDSYLKQLTISNAAANVESIIVNFEGEEVQLCEVAQIQKKPNLVVLQFTSFPEAIKPAMKAIQDSGMHASMQQESTFVYLHFPKVTRQQREDMAKSAKTLFQKCKDELAQAERRATKEIRSRKDGQSQDLIYNAQQQVKYEVEQTVIKAEAMMKTKQNELLSEG